MFSTGKGIKIEFNDIPDAILNFYNKNKECQHNIIIGTDSQNFSDTKIVSVIAITCEGHGGIYFYEISRIDRISDVRQKLYQETSDSLRITEALIDLLASDNKYSEVFDNCPISIHVDAGNSDKGKTKALIPEIVGWIKSCGYNAQTKPDSFVASSIADKHSK